MWNRCVFLQNHLLSWWSSFWWNHDQYLSILILKSSSQSVSPIKHRTFAMLPIQQLYRRVLMVTEIHKLWGTWHDGFVSFMSNAFDLFPEQSFQRKLLSMFLIWCFYSTASPVSAGTKTHRNCEHQPLCMIKCWKQAFVKISTSLSILILSRSLEHQLNWLIWVYLLHQCVFC